MPDTATLNQPQGQPQPVTQADRDLIATAQKRYKMAVDATTNSRNSELDDLRFMAGSPDNNWQWPNDVQSARGATNGSTINARPMLTINKLPQHVRQITNDQKQNRPEIKVIPVDDKGDPEVADVFNGIIRHIEYRSRADVAYDTANDTQVTVGEGYWYLSTDYVDEFSFEQDIKICRIRNPFSVYMDPSIQDPSGSDAQWCMITEDMLKEDFQALYPHAQAVSSAFSQGVGDQDTNNWFTQNTVKIASYYYCENENAQIVQMDVPELGRRTVIAGSREHQVAMQMLGARMVAGKDGQPVTRQTKIRRVKWCKITGAEVLERRDWAGKWIPVVRVVGNEWEVDGQLVVSGIVRNAKDPQRMYNYWVSQEAEMLALAPKAPFIGAAGQFEGFEEQWKQANIQNWPYLEYNPDIADGDGKPFPPPQRAAPPMPQAGIFQAKIAASDDIKATTGQYDPSLGARSNETSGKAIIARERQADTGTYHYLDNFMKAKIFTAVQLIDLIPKIYDTQRIARIIGSDGEVDTIRLDPNQRAPMVKRKDAQTGATIERIVNLGIGMYDVMATTGPSYMTKRQEFRESMAQLLQGNPELWKVAGDLFIKNFDFPGSQELARRFAKTIPPELKDDEDETPLEAQLKQELGKAQQFIQEQQQIMQEMSRSVEVQKQENEEFKADILAYKAETERVKTMFSSIEAGMKTMLAEQAARQAATAKPLAQSEREHQGG